MKRSEFIKILKDTISNADIYEANELISDVESYFDDSLQNGISEEEACAQLGDPMAMGKEFLLTAKEKPGTGKTAAQKEKVSDDLGELISKKVNDSILSMTSQIEEKMRLFSEKFSEQAKQMKEEQKIFAQNARDISIQAAAEQEALFKKAEEEANRFSQINLEHTDENSGFTVLESENGSLDIELENITDIDLNVRNSDIFISSSKNDLTRVIVCEEGVKDADKVLAKISDGKLVITNKEPGGVNKWSFFGKPHRSEIRIELGSDADKFPGTASFKTGSGDIEIDKIILLGIDVITGCGDICTNGIIAERGNIVINSASGDIEASTLKADGSIKLDSGIGDITLTNAEASGILDLHSSSGDIEVSRLSCIAGMTVSSSNGDITANDLISKDTIKIKTSNGDIEAENIQADIDIRISSGSGDITTGMLISGGEISTSTGAGDIELSGQASGSLVVSSGAGDAIISVNGFSKLKVKSGTGDIELNLPEGMDAAIFTKTGMGSLTADIPDIQSSGSDRQKTFITGDGTTEINLSTGCGDIIIQ